MSKLVDSFRAQMEAGKEGYKHKEAIGDVLYSTGFQNIDYLNGYMVHVKNDHEDYYYPQAGLPDGKTCSAIGRSGCGKSTLLTQVAANIVRPFQNGAIWHADLEGGSNDHRIEVLTRMSAGELADKYHYQDTCISSEVFYKQIKWLYDEKIKMRDELMYDTGIVNFKGIPIWKMEPTVYIIDSIPMLLPDDILDENDVSGQMSTTSSVKMNTFIFRKIQQLCKEVNIMALSVNHILEDVQINPMMHKKASINGLKQGERLPGGRSAQYLGNTMLRVDAGTALKPEEGFGINGFIATIQTVKSRTNASLKTVPMIFDKDKGFINELSLLQLLKANNKLKGAGSYLYIGDRSDIKFSQRSFLDMLTKYPELRLELVKESLPILETYMSKDDDLGYDNAEDNVDINELFKSMAMGKTPVLEASSVNEEKVQVPKKLKKSKEEVMDILSDMEQSTDFSEEEDE